MNILSSLFSTSTALKDFKYSPADCLSCQDPCDSHKQLTSSMQKKIDQSELYNSFKPYKYHLLLQKNEAWKEDESEESFKRVIDSTSEFKGRIMNTVYKSDHIDQLLVLPNGIKTSPDKLDMVIDFILKKRTDLQGETLVQSHIIMICAHMKRDKRCGVAGALLIEEFEKQLANANLTDKILLLPVSHIGGHKFAGNIIIYRRNPNPGYEADWYGRVKTCHVEAIIRDCIKQDLVIQNLFRGRMF
jgi:Sucrase/ferredoxin-like